MIKTILFFIVLIALSIFLTDFVKSKYRITNEEESKIAAKKIRYVKAFLLLFTLVLIVFSIYMPAWLYLGTVFSIYMLSDAFLEWKYNHKNRLYIVSLYQILLYITVIFLGEVFNLL